MKEGSRYKSLIVSCLLFIPSILSGETVLVTASGSPCDGLHILSVYQHGSGVYVTKFYERRDVPCVAVVGGVVASAVMDYPSIALREIDFFSAGDEYAVLWQNGKVLDTYNPDFGTGWVDSLVLGFIFLRHYPWIFHPELGWLFVREGPIDKFELNFWFFSPEEGWLWKKPSMDQYFHYNSGTWKEVSLFVHLDTEFNLSFNQEVTVIDEDLKIQFSEVIEDSRCPVDVECFWEGRLVINLKVNDQDLELSIGGESGPSKVIDGCRITLVKVVAPVPISDRVPKDRYYVISLLVEKES